MSVTRVRRAAGGAASPRATAAGTLLLVAALLDVAFWLNPPSRIGVGPWSVHLHWPVQVPMGALALYAVWGALRVLAGAPPRRPGHVHLLAGLLGAYFVAPLLALVSWVLERPPVEARPLDTPARARLRQAALYGLHLAVAVALLGYGTSTYFRDQATEHLEAGDSLHVGDETLRLAGTRFVADGASPFAKRVLPVFATADGAVEGELYYEPDLQAHFPLPATLRRWDHDLYVHVESVDVGPGTCFTSGSTVEAYQASGQICPADGITGARVTAVVLPGLSLMWAALLLFVLFMGMTIALEPRREV